MKIAKRKNNDEKISKYSKKVGSVLDQLGGGAIALERYPTSEVGNSESDSVLNRGCASHFSIPPENEIYITITITYYPSASYVMWDGYIPVLTSLRIFESRNEDVVKHVFVGAFVYSNSFEPVSLDPSPEKFLLERIVKTDSMIKMQSNLNLGDVAVGSVKTSMFVLSNTSEVDSLHYVVIVPTASQMGKLHVSLGRTGVVMPKQSKEIMIEISATDEGKLDEDLWILSLDKVEDMRQLSVTANVTKAPFRVIKLHLDKDEEGRYLLDLGLLHISNPFRIDRDTASTDTASKLLLISDPFRIDRAGMVSMI